MILEINLVKIDNMASMRGVLLDRNRYPSVADDSDMLRCVVKFINDNMDAFLPAVTDRNLIEKLRSLRNLTIQELYELRFVLASRFGIDLWIQFVADLEVNSEEVPDGTAEFNVIDGTTLVGITPFATKKVQLEKSISFTDIYSSINDMYGLFKENLFTGMANPLEGTIKSIREDEKMVGRVPVNRTAYMNSIIEFLGKQLKVIVN